MSEEFSPFEAGQRVWWVGADGVEWHGLVTECGRYDVVVDVDDVVDGSAGTASFTASFAVDEVYASPRDAWEAQLARVKREVDHFDRNLRLWVDRLTQATGVVSGLRRAEAQAVAK